MEKRSILLSNYTSKNVEMEIIFIEYVGINGINLIR